MNLSTKLWWKKYTLYIYVPTTFGKTCFFFNKKGIIVPRSGLNFSLFYRSKYLFKIFLFHTILWNGHCFSYLLFVPATRYVFFSKEFFFCKRFVYGLFWKFKFHVRPENMNAVFTVGQENSTHILTLLTHTSVEN